jgi:hypothetical protein
MLVSKFIPTVNYVPSAKATNGSFLVGKIPDFVSLWVLIV